MNGYVKLPLGGKDRGFKFDIKAVGSVLKRLDVPVDNLSKAMTDNPFEVYPIIVIEGLKRNAEKSKADLPDEDEVIEWIEKDGILSENVLNIIKAFGDSIVSLLPESKAVPNGKAKSVKK